MVTLNLSVTSNFCNHLNSVNQLGDEKKIVSSNKHKRELFSKLERTSVPSFLVSNEGKSYLIPLKFSDIIDSAKLTVYTVSELRNNIKESTNLS